MTPMQRIQHVLTTRGGPHLGDVLFWTLSDATLTRSTLVSTWQAHSLDVALLPELPTAEKALKAAIRDNQGGHPELLLRFCRESDAEVVFAVVREKRDQSGNLDYVVECRVALEKATERLTLDDASHDLARNVARRFRELRDTHSTDELRRCVVRTLASFSSVTLRENGGIYWTPSVHAGDVRRLQAAIESIGASKFHLLPVHDSLEAQQTLGAAAARSLEDELAAMKAEVAEFLAVPPDRKSTLTRRLDAFDGLRAKAQLYRDCLRVEVDDLDQQLDEMAAAVEGLLDQKRAA